MATADEGFSMWYQAEFEPVCRAVLVATADADLAREVTAEAFVRAYAAWDRVSAMGAPTAWVHRVAVNLVKRRWRRRLLEKRALRSLPGDACPPLEADVDLWRAVARLPDRQRLAISLRYVAGLKEREVAEAMGISEGAASATLATARRRLASELEPDLQEARRD